MKRIAIIGGGISGLSAAFALEQRRSAGAPLEYVLFESGPRLGGVLLTECLDDCLVEAGPDSFLTEKPWAADLCRQLGLADQLIGSRDAERKNLRGDQGPADAHARRSDVHGADEDPAHGFFLRYSLSTRNFAWLASGFSNLVADPMKALLHS